MKCYTMNNNNNYKLLALKTQKHNQKIITVFPTEVRKSRAVVSQDQVAETTNTKHVIEYIFYLMYNKVIWSKYT